MFILALLQGRALVIVPWLFIYENVKPHHTVSSRLDLTSILSPPTYTPLTEVNTLQNDSPIMLNGGLYDTIKLK